MRSIPLILVVTVLGGIGTLRADADGACTAPEADQFDFYIGTWAVEQAFPQPDGTVLEFPATTTVERSHGGCVLVEHWRGEVQTHWSGMEAPVMVHGFSVRAWDPVDEVWNIQWLDSRRPRLGAAASGTFEDGVGEFLFPPQGDDPDRFARIRFHEITATSLEWDLTFTQDGGDSWRTLWTMSMRRVGE